MKTFIKFMISLAKEAKDNDLYILANELSYKTLLAFFPFLIFLMTILGFLNIDGNILMDELSFMLPVEIMEVIEVFVREVIDSKNVSLLSSSLLVVVMNISSGFKAIMRGVNKTYGHEETRSFLRLQLASVVLMLVFSLSIAAMLVILMFGKSTLVLINQYITLPRFTASLFGYSSALITMAVLLITVMFIYKIANCKKTGFINVFPGSLFTVLLWVVSSKVFTVYYSNYSRYSRVYGSIAGLFILILWLNLIITLLLLGSEVNALLEVK